MTARRSWWRQPRSWVILGMILFAAYFSLVNVLRQVNLQTSQFDMGNMDQTLWNTIHGRIFQMTSPVNAVHELRTAVHADFLLLAYVPFYLLWPDPRVMMIVQTLAVASGAWPLFLFARRRVGETLGAFLSLSYLLYPGLVWSVVFDVHAVVLATPLLLWAGWAMTERRWWVYGLCLGAALLSKEEIGLTIGLFGLYTAWRQRPRWIGLVTFIIGVGWTTLMLGYVIPHARQAPGHFALDYYTQYGSSLGQIVQNLLLHPWKILVQFFNRAGLGYLTTILGPLGFIPLAGLPLLVVATPELAVNLLSNNPNLQSIYFQYTAVLTPFIYLSAVLGLAALRRWTHRHPGWWQTVLSVLVSAQAIAIYWQTPLPFLRQNHDAIQPFITSSYRASVAHVKQLVQPTDKLATTNNIAAQFTQREYEWAFPNHVELADGAVILATKPFDVFTADELRAKAKAMTMDPQWQLVFRDRDLYYFRRVP